MAKKEYRFKISGVHYAANPEAETKRLPDTEEMHVRTRELLTKIDRERPLVSLFAEPTNLFNPDCGITGSVLLIIFRSLISLCFITCLIRISFNLKKDQKNRPHDPSGGTSRSATSLFPTPTSLSPSRNWANKEMTK